MPHRTCHVDVSISCNNRIMFDTLRIVQPRRHVVCLRRDFPIETLWLRTSYHDLICSGLSGKGPENRFLKGSGARSVFFLRSA